jgi:hypothetical protein
MSEVYNTSKELETMQQVAADAVEQLVESKKIAESYQSDLKKLDKKEYKDQIKVSKDIIKKIDHETKTVHTELPGGLLEVYLQP